MHNTILQRVKQFLDVKMINLEKIKYEKCQAPLLRRPAPAPYFHHLFKNFSESPPPGEVIKIYFPTLKRGGSKLCWFIKDTTTPWRNTNRCKSTSVVFRKNIPLIKHLLTLLKKIRPALDQNIFACSIFINLQKAFDTVNYDILLHKLVHYGIRGLPNKWFQSFLSRRSQYTNIKNKSSNKFPITHGVPKGPVFGPFLFILYIKHLNKAIIQSYVYHRK